MGRLWDAFTADPAVNWQDELNYLAAVRPGMNPLERLAAVPGDVLGTAGHVLQLPLRGVKSVLGNVNAAVAEADPTIHPDIRTQLAQQAARGESGEAKFETLTRNDPMVALIAEIALDPLSYTGLGLPSKILPLANAIKNPAVRAGTVAALKGLEKADRLAPTVSSAAMDRALRTPEQVSRFLGKKGVPVVGELFDPSQQTVFAQRMRDLADGLGEMKVAGLDLREQARDLAQARKVAGGGTLDEMPAWPGMTRAPGPAEVKPFSAIPEGDPELMKGVSESLAAAAPPDAMNTLSPMLKALRAEIMALPTAEARAAAVQLKGQQEDLLRKINDEAHVIQEQVRQELGDAALSGATARTPELSAGYDKITAGYQQAFERSVDLIQSARWAVKELGERFPLAEGEVPDAAKLARVDKAMDQIDRALKNWGPKIRGVPAEERAYYVGKRNQAIKRAVTMLTKDIGPLPDEVAGLIARRQEELGLMAHGTPGFLANVSSRFEGDTDLLEKVANKIDELGKSKRKGVLAPPEGTDLYDLALNEVGEQVAKELGLRDPGLIEQWFGKPVAQGLGRAGGLVSGLWREFALAAPGYLANNLSGGLVANQFEHVANGPVLRQMGRNVGRLARREEAHSDELDTWLARTGQQAPAGLSTEAATQAEALAASELGKRGARRASEIIGPKALGIGGAALGGVAGELKAQLEGAEPGEVAKNVALGTAVGGGIGAGFGKWSKAIFLITAAMESAMREGAFLHRATEKTQEYLPLLMGEVEQAIGARPMTVRAGAAGRTLAQGGLTPAQQQQLMEDLGAVLARQDNLISPQAVEGLLIRHGIDPSRAREVGKFWADRMDDASQQGLKLAHKAHFDYQNLNNLEQFARGVMPFSTWSLKALPFYARHLAARPGLAVGIKDFNEFSDDYKREHGLTDRFTGGAPFGAGDVLFSALMGRPVTPFFNPLRAITPFGDVGRTAQTAESDEGALSKPLALLEGVMPGINPLAKTALRATGLLGNAAPQGFIGRTAPIEALTGINLNLPQEQLERTLREKIGGQEPLSYRDVAIDKRIDELAVQAGTTTRAKGVAAVPYQQAKASHKGPIYEQAKTEVARESSVRALAGAAVGSLAPQAILSEEEGRIREARSARAYAQLESGAAGELRGAMKRGEGAQAAEPRVMAAIQEQTMQLFGGQIPPVIERHLQAGTNAHVDGVRKALYTLQVGRDPLIAAYGPTGRTEQTKLEGLLAEYYSPGALLRSEPSFTKMPPATQDKVLQYMQAYQAAPPDRQERMRKGNPALAQALQTLRAKREQLRAQHPELHSYLAWEAGTKGKGTLEEYLASR
jgi:hypothetical protein